MMLRTAGVRRSGETLWKSDLARNALPALVVFVAMAGLAFANGGFFSGAWTAAAVALIWVTALVLMLADRVELTSLEFMWIGLLGGLLAWTALSTWWSLDHSESLLEVRRDLVYLAGVAAVLLLATRSSAGSLLIAVWSVVTLVVAYALVRYLFEPGLHAAGFQGNLLFRPLGYANALGIFTGLAGILSVAFAARAPARMLRALAAASIAPLAAALYLTSSRGSVLAVGVGLAAMLVVDRDRRELLGACVVVAPVGAAVVALSAHSGLNDEATVGAEAARQGHLLFLWIALGAATIAFAHPLAERTRRWAGRLRTWRLAAAASAGAIGGAAFLAPRGAQLFNTSFRTAYWHVAWREFSAHPWLGSGAGTFGDYWERFGNQAIAGGALDAHNLYLETLAELGPPGLALLGALLVLPLAAALRVRRQPFASAATGAYVAFLSHAALDWDWEMPAVTLAGLVCAAALVVANRDGSATARRLSARARGGAFVVTCSLALFALLAQFRPWLGGVGP